MLSIAVSPSGSDTAILLKEIPSPSSALSSLAMVPVAVLVGFPLTKLVTNPLAVLIFESTTVKSSSDSILVSSITSTVIVCRALPLVKSNVCVAISIKSLPSAVPVFVSYSTVTVSPGGITPVYVSYKHMTLNTTSRFLLVV